MQSWRVRHAHNRVASSRREGAVKAERAANLAAREARAARNGGDRSAKRLTRLLAPRRQPRIPATRSRLARLRPARAR